MIVIKLKEAKLAIERRTSRRWTWQELAKKIGIPKDTLVAMANRERYNTTLNKIDQICSSLKLPVGEVLEHKPDSSPSKDKGSASTTGNSTTIKSRAGSKKRPVGKRKPKKRT